MGFDQKDETGFDKPLASFDTETEARNYAEEIARTKPDSTVKSGSDADK